MKHISIYLSLLSITLMGVFGFLFFTNNSFNNSEVKDEVTEVSSLKAMYNVAVETGYNRTYDSWEVDIETGNIQLRVIDRKVEWKFISNIEWVHLYSIRETNAKWYTELIESNELELNEYFSVILNSNNNNSSYTIQEVEAGELAKKPVDPSFGAGHTFLGWFFEGELFDFNTPINQSYFLNALWDSEDYKISFDTNGAENINSIDVTYNESFVLETPKKDGYIFEGWYFNNQKIESGVYLFHYDITLTARWISKSYNITFVTNTSLVINDMVVQSGQNFVLPTPTKSGYVFNGWFNGDTKIESGIWNLLENIELTAKWSLTTYELSFNSNGGGYIESMNFKYGEEYILPVPVRGSFTFEGWYSDGVKIENGIWYYNNNLELTARWSGNIYTISFITNSTTNINSMSIQSGQSFTLPEISKAGYSFGGWFYNDTKIESGIWYFDNNLELEALWIIQTYVISFTTNIDLSFDNIVVRYGEQFTLPTVNDSKFSFLGWYNGSERITSGTFYYTSNLNLVAKWSADGSIVTYNTNGGDSIDSEVLQFGFEYTLQTPYKRGFTFNGWRYGSVLVEQNGYWGYETNVTLVASWKLTDFYISFIMDDGINHELNSEVFTVESEMTLHDAFKNYYLFSGWFLDANFEKEIKVIYNLAEDQVIFAKFDAINYEITYELNGTTGHNNQLTYRVTDGTVNLENPITEFEYSHWYLDSGMTRYVPSLSESVLALLESEALEFTLYAYAGDTYGNRIIHKDLDFGNQSRNFMYFGTYPQTIVSDIDVINDLSVLTETNEKGYYLYKGQEYAKMTCEIDEKVFSDGTISVLGEEYFFKVEPIQWRVMYDGGKPTIITHKIIDTTLFYGANEDRVINGKTIYPSNYEYSDVRQWLNDDFYNIAFNSDEKNAIAVTNVDNSATSSGNSKDTYACNNTDDKIYLISYVESKNSSYGYSTGTASDDDRTSYPTDFAICKGTNASNWLLRSNGTSSPNMIRNVVQSGSMINYFFTSYTQPYGVRPTLNLEY